MIEKLRGPLPLRLAQSLEDAGLRHTVEVAIDRRLPARLDHVEIDGKRHQIGMGHAAGWTAGRNAHTVGGHFLMGRVDPEAAAMGQERQTAVLVEDGQIVPERGMVAERQIGLPGRVTLIDGLGDDAVFRSGACADM